MKKAVCGLLQKREQELLELSKTVNQTRSRMDVAQSELDIYLSQHNTAVSQLNQAKSALQEAVDTLRERRAVIKDLSAKIPRCEEQLKKVSSCKCAAQTFGIRKVSDAHQGCVHLIQN